MTILGIDAGNHDVKVIGEGGAVKFPSSLGQKTRERRLTNEVRPDDMEVEFNGKLWFAGTLAGESKLGGTSTKRISKANDEVLIRVLLALFKCGDEDSDHQIVVGQPIKTHTPEEKDRIIKLLTGAHDIKVNGVSRNIRIRSVKVAAEGASIGLLDPIQGLSHILDVGSGTINWATVEYDGKKVRFIDVDSDTEEFGMSSRKQIALEEVTMYIGNTLSTIWHQHEPVRVVGAVADHIIEGLKQHFPISSVYRPTISVKKSDNVFSTETLDPVFANAAAFYAIARASYDKKK